MPRFSGSFASPAFVALPTAAEFHLESSSLRVLLSRRPNAAGRAAGAALLTFSGTERSLLDDIIGVPALDFHRAATLGSAPHAACKVKLTYPGAGWSS